MVKGHVLGPLDDGFYTAKCIIGDPKCKANMDKEF